MSQETLTLLMAVQDPGTRKGGKMGGSITHRHCWAWGVEGGGHSPAQAGERGAHKAALCPSHCGTAPALGVAAGHTRMAGTRELQHQPLPSCRKHSPAPTEPCPVAAGGGLCQALKWNFPAGHTLILLQPLCSTSTPRLRAGGAAQQDQVRAVPCWPRSVPALHPWGLSGSAAAHSPGTTLDCPPAAATRPVSS